VTAAPARHRPYPVPSRPAPPTDPAVQQQRRFRLAAALAGARLRLAVVPDQAVRRRQSVQVCSAARILTALGVRVRVLQPATPWPRHRPARLANAGDAGWLGDLALLTAVPRTTSGWSVVADRVLPPRTTSPAGTAPVDGPADAVLCHVVVRFRAEDGAPAGVPQTLADVVAAHGLVVEVELLPALEPAVLRATEETVAAA
jgi:hypothetical protein